MGVPMAAGTAHGRGGGVGTSPRGSPPSTGVNAQQPQPGTTGSGGGSAPARHAGPCPLSLCLSVDSEVYQIHPLSFCDKGICIFFFFKEKEIPDLSGLQQITG